MNALRRPPPHVAVAAVLTAMVVVVYGRVGSFPFLHLDDPLYTVANPFVPKGLTLPGIAWSFTTFHAANWHPVTWLSHMLDVSLFGMDAGAHHLVNVLFHLANTLLLFHLFRKMTGRMWESGLVAALFAVHPLHVESVAWVAERKDVLSTFFLMLALLAYARYCERPGAGRYLPVFLLLALGLMAKPMLVTAPFLLLLLDYWPLRRFGPAGPSPDGFGSVPPAKLFLEKVPLLLLSGVSCLVTYLAQEKGGAVAPLAALPVWARGENALISYPGYLWKTAWPSGLAVFYPHAGTGISAGKTVAAGLLLGGATAAIVRQARRRPYLPVGWLWFLGTLVPVSGWVQVGLQDMADRYTYLPSIGVFLMAAWGMGDLAARWRVPRLAAGAAVLWLAVLTAVAWNQVGYWRSNTLLFRHALEVTRDNWFIRNTFGWSLLKEGKVQEAEVQFREAIRHRTDYAEAYYNLGKALSRRETIDESIARFEDALRIRPGYAEAHNELGAALDTRGRTQEALAHYREALRLRPDLAEAHYNLGRALSRQNADDEAIVQFREAVRLRPDYAEAHNNLGALLARRGAFPEAVSQFREALRLKPDYAGARANLDRALEDMGKVPRGETR